MAISCFALLKPAIPQIMPAVIEQIVPEPNPDCISVCNNAAWAVGEIALQYASDPSPFEPFVQALIERLIPILLNTKSPKSLSENAAVTIGRIGLVCPGKVAPNLATFAQAWCTALWEIKDNEEKDSAFRGFCRMVHENPQGLSNVSTEHPHSSLVLGHLKTDSNRVSCGSAMPSASGNTRRSSLMACSDK
jgi:transportin-1